jgi:hypothetical protein
MATLLLLSSCDRWIMFHGIVHDKSGQPLQGVRVSLLVRGDTTDYRSASLAVIYDTIYADARKKLRKKGLSDDFIQSNGLRFYKPIPLYTNDQGLFASRTIMVPPMAPCPKCQLVFKKNGYKTITTPARGFVIDSVVMEAIH